MKNIVVILALCVALFFAFSKGEYYFSKDEKCPKCDGVGYYYVPMMGQQKCATCAAGGKITSSALDAIPVAERITVEEELKRKLERE
ncbi:MAG: hypothetical protein AB7F75_07185 [Planctomycetota bacterium]